MKLRWEKVTFGTNKPFLKADVVHVDIEFAALLEGRWWGNSRFCFDVKFTIHERLNKTNGWAYQLLGPNGINVYCKNLKEAKGEAEWIYRRILDSLLPQLNEGEIAKKLNVSLKSSKQITEDLNAVLFRKFCRNKKKKTARLMSLLEDRHIDGKVYYSRIPSNTGWMFRSGGNEPILIGFNYQEALSYINSGKLDPIPARFMNP